MANPSAELIPSGLETESTRKLADCMPAFYNEMRRIARSRLAGGHYTMLDTTALVHECFLKLRNGNQIEIEDSEHLFAYATSTMRSVVVDYVRQRKATRRGGGAPHESLNHQEAEESGVFDDEVLSVHGALEALANVDARLVRVVEMRYFVGLSDEEVGQALGVSDRTVRRDWDRAKLLLAGLLGR